MTDTIIRGLNKLDSFSRPFLRSLNKGGGNYGKSGQKK